MIFITLIYSKGFFISIEEIKHLQIKSIFSYNTNSLNYIRANIPFYIKYEIKKILTFYNIEFEDYARKQKKANKHIPLENEQYTLLLHKLKSEENKSDNVPILMSKE